MLLLQLLVTVILAYFAHATPVTLMSRNVTSDLVARAGPSGTLVIPAGGTTYDYHDSIHVKYKRVIQYNTVFTRSIAVKLYSKDPVTGHVSADVPLASFIGSNSDYIDVLLPIPDPRLGLYTKPYDGVSYQLVITEYQTDALVDQALLGPVFRSAAPHIKITGINWP